MIPNDYNPHYVLSLSEYFYHSNFNHCILDVKQSLIQIQIIFRGRLSPPVLQIQVTQTPTIQATHAYKAFTDWKNGFASSFASAATSSFSLATFSSLLIS